MVDRSSAGESGAHTFHNAKHGGKTCSAGASSTPNVSIHVFPNNEKAISG